MVNYINVPFCVNGNKSEVYVHQDIQLIVLYIFPFGVGKD
jgi:hypothetical protein